MAPLGVDLWFTTFQHDIDYGLVIIDDPKGGKISKQDTASV